MSTFECMCCHCTLNVVLLITEEIHPFLLLLFFPSLGAALFLSVSLFFFTVVVCADTRELVYVWRDHVCSVLRLKKTCTSEWNSTVRTWNLKCGQHQKFNIFSRFSLCVFGRVWCSIRTMWKDDREKETEEEKDSDTDK